MVKILHPTNEKGLDNIVVQPFHIFLCLYNELLFHLSLLN